MEISFDNRLNHANFSLAGMYNGMYKMYAHVQMMYKKKSSSVQKYVQFFYGVYVHFFLIYVQRDVQVGGYP